VPDGYHPPSEEYLEAVHDLEEEGIPVIQARLVERLGHAAPTVSEMVRRLRDEGFVHIDGRAITLTSDGRHKAEGVVRKHRLAERLLTDILGLEWHKAHNEAARWEHVISDEVEERLVEVLGNPTTCPHGNPIPGAALADIALKRLADAVVGETIRLERVTEQVEFDKPALTYLGENHFTPGTEALVQEVDHDGNMLLAYDGRTLAISASLGQLLFVAA
jgi:DtxR family Mn-dependent transcriptional regulator